MRLNKLVPFAFLGMCLFCAVDSRSESPKVESGVALVSDSRTGTILIDATLNGSPVTMILDTGASHSLVDATTFGMTDMQLQVARMNSRGLGLDADVVWRTANLQMADLQWKQQSIEVADLRKLSKIYRRKIDGIVGEDILRNFRSVQINYKWGCVMFVP